MDQVQKLFEVIPGGDTQAILFLYFIGSAIFAFITAPLIISLLYKFNIRRVSKGDVIAQMDEEKGKIGVPIMGGLIFVLTTLVITYAFNWERNYTWLPIGAMVFSACIGAVDDLLNIFGKIREQPKPIRVHAKLILVHRSIWKRIYYFLTLPWAIITRSVLFIGSKPKSGLQVHEKLILQAFIGVTVGLWVYQKLGWSDVWIPYILRYEWIQAIIEFIPGFVVREQLSSVTIGWLMVPFIALTIMTVSNAVNISDGMDGLAGGLLFIAFAAYAIIAFGISEIVGVDGVAGYRHIAYLCATAAGGLLAYLYFNVKPARVQMADIGSLGFGTLLTVVAIVLHREFTLLFIAGVFLFNAIFARFIQAFWKKFFGKRIFRIIPLHYHFEMKGWPEEKVVMRFWIVSILLTAIGVYLAGI